MKFPIFVRCEKFAQNILYFLRVIAQVALFCAIAKILSLSEKKSAELALRYRQQRYVAGLANATCSASVHFVVDT